MSNTYQYQINLEAEVIDSSVPRKEVGRFELSFNDGAFGVITHMHGGIFNFWLDNMPSFNKFLYFLMAGGDHKVT